MRETTQGCEYQKWRSILEPSWRLATTLWKYNDEWTNGVPDFKRLLVQSYDHLLAMMSKELDRESRQFPPILMSSDFVFLGTSSLITISSSHHFRTSSSNSYSSDMGVLGSPIVPLHNQLLVITQQDNHGLALCAFRHKVYRQPYSVVFLSRTYHCLWAPSWEHRVSDDNTRRTQRPIAGPAFDPTKTNPP